MMKLPGRSFLIGCMVALCAAPAFAASKPDCSKMFSFELNTKLSLRNLKVLSDPHHDESGGAYMDVREFDRDFRPLRGKALGIAVVSASGLEASDDVTGGMILAKEPAYFMEAESQALNAKGGLNAVFEAATDDDCAGTTYTVHFDNSGVLSINGKPVAKVQVSRDPN
jgi:hypothetical protein